MSANNEGDSKSPRILIFSTNNISDLGIDLAGSSHMDYTTCSQVISVPCSSGINPQWILHALEAGFDGVCSAYGGYNFPGDDPFHLRRIHGDPETIRLKNWLTLDPRKLHTGEQLRWELGSPSAPPTCVATEPIAP